MDNQVRMNEPNTKHGPTTVVWISGHHVDPVFPRKGYWGQLAHVLISLFQFLPRYQSTEVQFARLHTDCFGVFFISDLSD